MSWESVVQKLDYLSEAYLETNFQQAIIDTTANLEHIKITEFTQLLEKIHVPRRKANCNEGKSKPGIQFYPNE